MARLRTQADEKAIWVGPTMVCDANMLDTYTTDGWVLLERYEVETTLTVSISSPDPSPQAYTGSMICHTAPAPERSSMFLIGKTEETALAEAIQKEAEVCAKLSDASDANTELQKAFEQMKVIAEQNLSNADGRKEQLDRKREDFETERSLRRNLEADMSKVIARIGQREWDAAVGEGEGTT